MREVGLGEGGSEGGCRTGSPGNVGEMEVEVRFQEKGNKGGEMDR